MSVTALLVVDPQNDFLAAGGAFSRRHFAAVGLAQEIAGAVVAARKLGHLVVWVTSAYGDAPHGSRGLTHVGSPCCVPDTWGAEVFAPLRPLFEARGAGAHIVKRWYSAFRETDLHARLSAAGVRRTALVGVTTNGCVMAAARDAHTLGYEVVVLADATAAGTTTRHLGALREIELLGGRSGPWRDLLAFGVAP